MDAAGMLSGRRVKRGEVIGQVGNYNDFAGGTTYHLHFDLQVPTKAGWVLVNPYMTLVAAYEHLLGARGTRNQAGRSGAGRSPPCRRSSRHPDATARASQTEEAAAAKAKGNDRTARAAAGAGQPGDHDAGTQAARAEQEAQVPAPAGQEAQANASGGEKAPAQRHVSGKRAR